jgi:hypothetical protein
VKAILKPSMMEPGKPGVLHHAHPTATPAMHASRQAVSTHGNGEAS